MTTVEPIIIDCDPGIDDALGLIYATSHEALNVLAIHTVAGNVNVDYTTRNTRLLMGALDKDIPIFCGAGTPLVDDPFFADDIHGESGFGRAQLSEEFIAPLSKETALESYINLLEKATEPVTIVAIGPLTNIAILLLAYPHLKEKIKQISVMGGSLTHGNVTLASEFNFYADPHAASVVSKSGVPIVLAGLHITEQTEILESDLEDIKSINSQLGKFILDLSHDNLSLMESYGRSRVVTPHDIMPFVQLVKPELFKATDYKVVVSTESATRGQTLCDTRDRYNGETTMSVIMTCDNEAYRRHFKETIANTPINY